jgi:hypothetical protein
MTVRIRPANAIVRYALTGGDAHIATRSVFDGLDWRVAGARVPAEQGCLPGVITGDRPFSQVSLVPLEVVDACVSDERSRSPFE